MENDACDDEASPTGQRAVQTGKMLPRISFEEDKGPVLPALENDNHHHHHDDILIHGNRPTYFRDRGTTNLDAAWDEVLYLRLILRNLESIHARVDHLHKVLEQNVLQHKVLEKQGRVMMSDQDKYEECSEWLVDFIAWNPIERLKGMIRAAETIVRAHGAMSDGLISRDEVTGVVDENAGNAAVAAQGKFEDRVRLLLWNAPDECKDVLVCLRLLDWPYTYTPSDSYSCVIERGSGGIDGDEGSAMGITRPTLGTCLGAGPWCQLHRPSPVS